MSTFDTEQVVGLLEEHIEGEPTLDIQKLSDYEIAGLLLARQYFTEPDEVIPKAAEFSEKIELVDTRLKTLGTPVLVYKGGWNGIYNPSYFYHVSKGGEDGGLQMGVSNLGKPTFIVDDLLLNNKPLLVSYCDPDQVLSANIVDHLEHPTVPVDTEDNETIFIGDKSIEVLLERLIMEKGSDKPWRAEDAIKRIWDAARKVGVRLENESKVIYAWFQEHQEEIARQHGIALEQLTERRYATLTPGEKIPLHISPDVEAFEVSDDMIKRAAAQHLMDKSRSKRKDINDFKRPEKNSKTNSKT